MRISGGYLKGSRLPSPKGRNVRPTSARVLKSLLDVISPRIKDAIVLDLFAGSGNFGFELLSRGAAHVTFVDISRDVCRSLENSVKMFELEHSASVMNLDFGRALERLSAQQRRYSIVFLDPPYESDYAANILVDAHLRGIIADSGIVILESTTRATLPKNDAWETIFSRSYGDTRITIYSPLLGI